MDQKCIRTGKQQLEINTFVDNFGSMARSTKCCGTGTCGSVSSNQIQAPVIAKQTDGLDAAQLQNTFGPLIK